MPSSNVNEVGGAGGLTPPKPKPWREEKRGVTIEKLGSRISSLLRSEAQHIEVRLLR